MDTREQPCPLEANNAPSHDESRHNETIQNEHSQNGHSQNKQSNREVQAQALDYRLLADAMPQMVWLASPDGKVDFYNQRWLEYTGLTLQEATSWGCERILHPDDLERCMEEWQRAVANGHGFESECRFRRASDGTYRWHLSRATPLRDSEEHIVKWIGTCTDIDDYKRAQETLQQSRTSLEHQVIEHTADLQRTIAVLNRQIAEREQVEKALRASQERYRRIVETANEGIWAIDEQFRTIYINQQMSEMIGYTPEEVLGRLITDFVFAEDRPTLEQRLALRRQGQGERYHVRYQRKDGSELWVRVSATPVLDDDGSFQGAFAMFTDITGAKRAEAALRASEELYRDLIENANDLIYRTDAEGHFTFFNETALHLMQYPAEFLRGLHYLELIHPDYREAARRFYGRQFLRRLEDSYYEFPAVTKSGHTIWFGQHTHLIFEDEEIVGFQAVARDITERKRAEEELRESEERFKHLAEAAFEAIVIVENGIIVDANSAFCRMYGYERGEVIGKSALEFTAPDARELVQKMISNGREGIYQSRGLRRNGTIFPTEILGRSIPYHGRTARVAAIRDITERKQYEQQIEEQKRELEEANNRLEEANARLEALAAIDGLTGLKNHRIFQERLAEEAQRAARYGAPLSLLMIDVDKFKQYNDTFGHPAGDIVLKTVARLLEDNARDIDVVARYGGEEFAVILPQTDATGAYTLAERIRKAVETAPWPQRPVTISGGFATIRSPRIQEAELIARADQALYQSKAAGRNRITEAL